ncbi:MAG TPA: hypothetical protein DEV93_01695 [Chloroflexi bacterium]|jgi:hypothetical protein|nr:hypothetical protein [Chloroflexota bacterium]
MNLQLTDRARLFVAALITLGLLAAYDVLRVIAGHCSGARCETYVPISLLLLPALILVAVVGTGLLSIAAAQQRAQDAPNHTVKRGQVTWLSVLRACTRLGVFGPIVSVAVFRSSPDLVLLVATLLAASVPISALAFTLVGNWSANPPPAP